MTSHKQHIPGEMMVELHKLLEHYIYFRYEEYTIDELCTVRRILKNIEADYEADKYTHAPTIEIARKSNAGRKPAYSENNFNQIIELRSQGHSIRKIAELTHCPAGRVSSVLKKQKTMKQGLTLDDEFWKIIDKMIKESEEANS